MAQTGAHSPSLYIATRSSDAISCTTAHPLAACPCLMHEMVPSHKIQQGSSQWQLWLPTLQLLTNMTLKTNASICQSFFLRVTISYLYMHSPQAQDTNFKLGQPQCLRLHRQMACGSWIWYLGKPSRSCPWSHCSPKKQPA